MEGRISWFDMLTMFFSPAYFGNHPEPVKGWNLPAAGRDFKFNDHTQPCPETIWK